MTQLGWYQTSFGSKNVHKTSFDCTNVHKTSYDNTNVHQTCFDSTNSIIHRTSVHKTRFDSTNIHNQYWPYKCTQNQFWQYKCIQNQFWLYKCTFKIYLIWAAHKTLCSACFEGFPKVGRVIWIQTFYWKKNWTNNLEVGRSKKYAQTFSYVKNLLKTIFFRV